jgi:hypothetical protein
MAVDCIGSGGRRTHTTVCFEVAMVVSSRTIVAEYVRLRWDMASS